MLFATVILSIICALLLITVVALLLNRSSKELRLTEDLIKHRDAINNMETYIENQNNFIQSQQEFITQIKGINEAERKVIEKQNQIIRNGFGHTKEISKN